MNQSTRIFSVEHVQVRSTRPFAEVVRRIEAETGIFDGAMVRAALEQKVSPSLALDAIASMAGRSGFMRFAALDHGAVLRLQGKPAEAVRFLIGHPLTASKITQLRIRTSLYAPLSLLVASDGSAGTPRLRADALIQHGQGRALRVEEARARTVLEQRPLLSEKRPVRIHVAGDEGKVLLHLPGEVRISRAAALRSTGTPTRSPRRSSRRSTDRTDASRSRSPAARLAPSR